MNIAHLIDMANDIGRFFDGESGLDAGSGSAEAAQRIAQHITRFWEPRMRAAIIEHAAAGGAGLSASALAAVRSLLKESSS